MMMNRPSHQMYTGGQPEMLQLFLERCRCIEMLWVWQVLQAWQDGKAGNVPDLPPHWQYWQYWCMVVLVVVPYPLLLLRNNCLNLSLFAHTLVTSITTKLYCRDADLLFNPCTLIYSDNIVSLFILYIL